MGSLDQRSGGPLRAVLDLSAMGMELGLSSEILGLDPLAVPDNPIPVKLIHSLPTKGPVAYGYSPALRPWCRANLNRFDGVMLHGLWGYSNWAVSQECLAAGLPYVCFPHGSLDLWPVRGQGLWKRAKKTLYWKWRARGVVAGSAAVLFATERELQNARRTFALPPNHRLVVVPYGIVPMEKLQSKPSRNIMLSPKANVALFLGRVHPKKRPDLLIKAWQKAALPPEWRLVIAGPGEPEYLRYLAALAAQCQVADAVEFTGPVAGADKQYLFQRASWFLLPSEQENFGIAVMEAALSDCAVAISDQVYIGDAFPKTSEILPLDVTAWARFMAERMTDDGWRDMTARQTKEALTIAYGVDTVIRGWVAAIRELLGHGTAPEQELPVAAV